MAGGQGRQAPTSYASPIFLNVSSAPASLFTSCDHTRAIVRLVHPFTHRVAAHQLGLTGWNLRAFCLYACFISFLSAVLLTPRRS